MATDRDLDQLEEALQKFDPSADAQQFREQLWMKLEHMFQSGEEGLALDDEELDSAAGGVSLQLDQERLLHK